MWRTDGQPIWENQDLLADPELDRAYSTEHASKFATALAQRLNVNPDHVCDAYEDALYYLWKEQRLPANENLRDADLKDDIERARMARILDRRLTAPVGCLLPLFCPHWSSNPGWVSGLWPVRTEQMYLLPGDSPMGLRLPLDSLPPISADEFKSLPVVPFETARELPEYQNNLFAFQGAATWHGQRIQHQVLYPVGGGGEYSESSVPATHEMGPQAGEAGIVRTAMCFEPRDGNLHIFMPPVDRLEDYLGLLHAIEATATELDLPVVIEGYLPPTDYRLRHIKVTPDPGVIEVNVQPAHDWKELVQITTSLYDDARQSRLGTEKFDADGTHTGTGGGNHVVIGAPKPVDSPFLRRPDLLRSLIGYWHNHPSLSYLFSGRFIGPTSQAPRVDEGRRDALYELQIAFEQIPAGGDCPPWLVDRAFRHLLVDLTGNTHRAEFCIDKLYSPESSTGRLGLVEFRAFEMPPHAQMSLAQQLLLRALVARFWEGPYLAKLVDWDTSIHDRWMLPHFVQQDFEDVITETNRAGISLESDWFVPHFEFRFPAIGEFTQRGIHVELRTAIEPWYVLGEEPSGGQTARFVDSSVERMQAKVSGMTDGRHFLSCNGRKVPLHPTGGEGEFVAGIRYRAWQPPSCLHPTIQVDAPLVFDLVDAWTDRSIGGCTYYVGHPGGLNAESFPVNSYEAESRRAARFSKMGHTGERVQAPREEKNFAFPLTLDLRRNPSAS